MRLDKNLPRRLRSLFGTLTFLSLLVAGLAYGAGWMLRGGLERDAVAEAGKSVGSVVEPALRPHDLRAPVSDERYRELLEVFRKRVVAPPVESLEIWNEQGTVVFADDRSRMGQTVRSMRAPIQDTLTRGSLKLVEGDTFRSLVAVRLSGDAVGVVEIDRSNASLVAQAEDRWGPWIGRGVRAAAACLALYLLMVGVSAVERRRRAGAAAKLPQPVRTSAAPPPAEDAHLGVRRRTAADAPGPDAPAYMQPGFREQMRARQEAEGALASAQQALNASERDRERLQERLRQAETELQEARRR